MKNSQFHFLKKCILFLFCVFVSFLRSNAQTYSTNSSLPLNLTAVNVIAPTCVSANSVTVDIPVAAGLGNLSSNFAVTKVNIQFLEDCSGNTNTSVNLNNMRVFLRSPSGTCIQIYAGGFSSVATGFYDVSFVTSGSCLNAPNTSNAPTAGPSSNSSGNFGIYSATSDLTTSFVGENPTGTWQLVFYENTSSEPCLGAASIVFGNPTVDDQTGNGNSCITPIVWDGGPICASTNSMTSSSQMPGWAGPGAATFGTFNGGVTCNWNGANNNDVWLQFTAQTTNVCINLSGLDNNQQSVVVSDPNTDGDNNPCTGANGGQYWNLISCPNPSSYTTTAGTTVNQNHCFTAVVGQTYYMVVDGNGGAESPFYVSGISGTSYNLITLPIELISFEAHLNNRQVDLFWQTATEHNNDYFSVERSHDGTSWETIENLQGAGNSSSLLSYQTYDFYPYRGIGYYRLKQVDYDGKTTFSEIQRVYKTDDLLILPNPSAGVFGIGGMPKHQENSISVLDITGKELEHYTTEDESYQLDLTHRTAGIYFVIINGFESIKIIKN